MAANVNVVAFWDIAPCSLVEVDRRFSKYPNDGGTEHLRNVGLLHRDYTAVYPIRLSSFSCTISLITLVMRQWQRRFESTEPPSAHIALCCRHFRDRGRADIHK
jgi:hypothetical protein